jgi:hypothetical protein
LKLASARHRENAALGPDHRRVHYPPSSSSPLSRLAPSRVVVAGPALLRGAASGRRFDHDRSRHVRVQRQKYSYVPGVVNVKENLSFVSSVLDLKALVLEISATGSPVTRAGPSERISRSAGAAAQGPAPAWNSFASRDEEQRVCEWQPWIGFWKRSAA